MKKSLVTRLAVGGVLTLGAAVLMVWLGATVFAKNEAPAFELPSHSDSLASEPQAVVPEAAEPPLEAVAEPAMQLAAAPEVQTGVLAAPEATPAVNRPGPRIMSPAPEFNYGSVDADTKIEHDFIVRNVGDAPLELANVKTSCGCTVAALKQKTLQPGEETTITATLSNKGRQGPQTRHLTVESNDRVQPLYRLTLTGVAVTSINVEPRLLNFGRIADDDAHTQTIKVDIDKKKRPVRITSVESTSPEFQTEIRTLEDGGQYEILVSTAPKLEPKLYTSRLSINTDSKESPAILVNATAQVVGDLEVSPPHIQVRNSDAPGETSSQYIRVAAGRSDNFEIQEAQVPGSNVEVLIQPRAKNDYLVRLSNMPLDGSLAGKELVLKTNLANTPEVRVPFVITAARQTITPGASRAVPAPTVVRDSRGTASGAQ